MFILHAIFAVAFIGAGIFTYIMLGTVPWAESGLSDEFIMGIRYGFPGVFLLAGGLFVISAVRSLLGAVQNREMADKLLERGIETTGQVTFIDRNWSIRVNERPIYSIIEYVFEANGQQYTRRKTDAPTETVIRSGLAVGQSVPVFYLPEDPDQNMLLIGSQEQLNQLRAESKRKAKPDLK